MSTPTPTPTPPPPSQLRSSEIQGLSLSKGAAHKLKLNALTPYVFLPLLQVLNSSPVGLVLPYIGLASPPFGVAPRSKVEIVGA